MAKNKFKKISLKKDKNIFNFILFHFKAYFKRFLTKTINLPYKTKIVLKTA